MTKAIIRGSWGDVTVDRATGFIIDYNDGGRHGWSPEDRGYSDILFFLPHTLAPGRDACLDKHGETDILCVGFVCERGIVTEPMQRHPDDGEHEDSGLMFDPLLLAAPKEYDPCRT